MYSSKSRMKNFLNLPFLVATIILVQGCNSDDAPTNENPPQKVVDAAEMKAAQSLSIGSVRAIADDVGPYVQALRCNIALGAIYDHLSEGGSFSGDQKKLMAQMRARYAREAKKIGAQQKKSSQQIQQDLDGQASKIADLSIRAQIAIGCLRKSVQAS